MARFTFTISHCVANFCSCCCFAFVFLFFSSIFWFLLYIKVQKNTIKRKLLEVLAWTKNDEMEVDNFFFYFWVEHEDRCNEVIRVIFKFIVVIFCFTLCWKFLQKPTPLVKAVSRAKSAGFKGARCQTSDQ